MRNLTIVESNIEPNKEHLWLHNGIIKYYSSNGWVTLDSSGEDIKELDNKIKGLESKLSAYPSTPQKIPTATTTQNGLMSAEDKAALDAAKTEITELESELVTISVSNAHDREKLTPSGIIDGYYIDKMGQWNAFSSGKVYYFQVTKYQTLYAFGSQNAANVAWAFFKNIPTTTSKPDEFTPWTSENDNNLIAPGDGYIAVSTYIQNDVPILYLHKVVEYNDIIAKNVSWGYKQHPAGTLYGYIHSSGIWYGTKFTYQISRYYAVKKGEAIYAHSQQHTNFSAWSFWRNTPTHASTPDKFIPWASSADNYLIAPEDGYVMVGGPNLVNDEKDVYLRKARPYDTKCCIYIGDSISTMNNYYWKGILEDKYGLSYIRNVEGKLAPAVGGIAVIPPVNEVSGFESIWYRCANARMSIYDFDMISLFGGTNDFGVNAPVGTIDDTAYVDDTTGITGDDNITSERPETLTFASALKGCYLMLRRDFPYKEIVLPTVMYCKNYGNSINQETKLRLSEEYALVQMQIAEKYGIKAIPLYWDMRKESTVDVFTQDGTHPNKQGANRIVAIFSQTIGLVPRNDQ